MKNDQFIWILVIFLSISSSCEKQEELPCNLDADGVVISMPYQWKSPISENGSLINGFLRKDIVYNKNVLFPHQDGDLPKIVQLSSSNGDILWEWEDLFESDRNFYGFSHFYQHDKYLVFQKGDRFYTLDLKSGVTLQKLLRDHHITGMTGSENIYFSAGNAALDSPKPYFGSIFSGTIGKIEEKLLITPNYSYEYVDGNGVTGFITGVRAFEDKNEDLLIAYGFADAQPDWKGNIYAGLYNHTQKKHVFEKSPLAIQVSSYATGTPFSYKEKLYFAADKSIFCLDLVTGKSIWEKSFNQGFSFSGFIIVEDKIIANSEDTYLYALDPETGQQLWKEKSSGTSSKMVHLNGVVYFVGGGDGLLHAVEIATGKHLWRIRSPDLAINRGAWFMPMVTVLPPESEGDKGKVILSSYLSAFCYEAAR